MAYLGTFGGLDPDLGGIPIGIFQSVELEKAAEMETYYKPEDLKKFGNIGEFDKPR